MRLGVSLVEAELIAFAPRLTLPLPVGRPARPLEADGLGMQVDMVINWALARPLTAQLSIENSLTPHEEDWAGPARVLATSVKQLMVWNVTSRWHVLVDTVWQRSQRPTWGDTASHTLHISPALQWGHDLADGLHIIPGVCLPVGFGPSRSDRAVLAFFSFEHRLRPPARSPLER